MKMNANVYKGLAIFSYIISGFTTLIFLVGFGVKMIDKLLGFMITALFEPSKPVLFVQIYKKHKVSIIIGIAITWAILEIGSIAASTNYMLNQMNAAIQSSDAYIQLKEKEKNLKDLIKSDKTALENTTKKVRK